MKKFLMALLALALVCSMAVPAFALDVSEGSNSGSQDVSAKYVAAAEAGAVYSVNIEWEAMTFTYTQASEKWDPADMKYVEDVAAKWEDDGKNDIIISNCSNKAVKATFSVEKESGYDAVTYKFSNTTDNAVTIGAATAGEDGANGTATSQTVELTLDGELAESAGTEATKIGTIKITLAGVEAAA